MVIKHHILSFLLLNLRAFRGLAQVPPAELAPLLAGLSRKPSPDLEKRVPLSTDDNTVAPLVDLQVYAPPAIPADGTSCSVQLLSHSFGDGSFNEPVVVPYTPPASSACGEIGKWSVIALNLTVHCAGTQYDRLGEIYLGHVEIWRTSSAEPTKTGTIWTTLKDVTRFTPLFAVKNDLMMDFSNIIAPELLLDGVFDVTLTATFHAPTKQFPTAKTPDAIIPLSNLSPTLPNFFTIADDAGATVNVTLPENTVEAYIEILCSGNSAEEFWYSNTPDEFIGAFPESTGLIGKGPFREVQTLVDGQLAGVVWPYGVIYTGGITPSNWRPLVSYGAYDAPSYWVDVTPFLPTLLSKDRAHNITLRVVGQGVSPSINSNWFVSGCIHVRTGTTKTTGKMTAYHAPQLLITTTGRVSAGNETVTTSITASREFMVESEINTSEGKKTIKFSQSLSYSNIARYANDGWIQWVNQTTAGTVVATHQGVQMLRDAFDYPIQVFSNYSLLTEEFGGYGSEIHQTYTRALSGPIGNAETIHSVQDARGEIGMDNWPGLRHAINGTGSTNQTFAYINGRGETYFRDIKAKNDGWVADTVWGTLRGGNPPVPQNQIFGANGGPGFRRAV
ncbi:peptide N-acetyl-beta-D-glucosaminyl asparaginase amidase A-domain-containing protein [Infundibulicybe gibba]|nr:peptide N-acetyl-beta-D-glucosaminyl asparaginase amidase A-domain-containing protein [Infundibulicybe gibba]